MTTSTPSGAVPRSPTLVKPQAPSLPARRRFARGSRAFKTLALAVVAAAFVIPLVWLVLASLKGETEIGATPLKILPRHPSLDDYHTAVSAVDFVRYFRNSVELAVIYTVPTVVSSGLTGYAFARLRARGKNVLFGFVIATLLIPLFVFVLPLFVIYSRVGLVGSFWPWFLWGVAGNPFMIFLFRQFYDAFPKEIEEAAEIDGCGRFAILWRVVLPNSKPIIATATILSLTFVWGETLIQSIFLTGDKVQTLSVRLAYGYLDPTGQRFLTTPLLAGIVLFALPIVVVFLIAQRQIIQGVATSGLR